MAALLGTSPDVPRILGRAPLRVHPVGSNLLLDLIKVVEDLGTNAVEGKSAPKEAMFLECPAGYAGKLFDVTFAAESTPY